MGPHKKFKRANFGLPTWKHNEDDIHPIQKDKRLQPEKVFDSFPGSYITFRVLYNLLWFLTNPISMCAGCYKFGISGKNGDVKQNARVKTVISKAFWTPYSKSVTGNSVCKRLMCTRIAPTVMVLNVSHSPLQTNRFANLWCCVTSTWRPYVILCHSTAQGHGWWSSSVLLPPSSE